MRKIGITSTVPLEILVAAGRRPVDLNNIFISGVDPQRMVAAAEAEGFPRSACAWIKGIYSAARQEGIGEVVAVSEGDCSNTRALMEVLSLEGISTIPFSYPHDRDPVLMRRELEKLMQRLGTDAAAVAGTKEGMDRVRRKLLEIDRLTWEEDLVSGGENHLYLVSSSDMNGDPAAFEASVDSFLEEARKRQRRTEPVRLAFLGVPPILTDLYRELECMGARVVFNETQRQFAMPYLLPDLTEQYLAYTYPYDIFHRLEDILPELRRRRVHGVIHYVQSFCFRQIEDIVLRRRLPLPVLTLEGDKPGKLDARTRIRLEGFVEMIGEAP
ncbi:MAG TPA: 2-hydroxyacyl-CoA dehydratase [Verrucomicrobiae bacterium]|nr:2-hydroxyacyl-CoA dehydratase [Verrucomicrobiae bacterium]